MNRVHIRKTCFEFFPLRRACGAEAQPRPALIVVLERNRGKDSDDYSLAVVSRILRTYVHEVEAGVVLVCY